MNLRQSRLNVWKLRFLALLFTGLCLSAAPHLHAQAAAAEAAIDPTTMGEIYARFGAKAPTLPTAPVTPPPAAPAPNAPPADPAAAEDDEPVIVDPNAPPAEEPPVVDPNAPPADPVPPEAFTAEQEELVTSRVTEAVTPLQQALADAEAQVASLKESKIQIVSADVDPLLLATDFAAIEKAKAEFNQFEAWATKNWDGVTGDETKGEPSWTAEEVRNTLIAARQKHNDVMPRAVAKVQQMQQANAYAKTVYPELFVPASPQKKAVDAFLLACPALKQFPDVMTMMGDALVGEKLRLEKAKAAKATTPAKPGAKPAAAPGTPPKAPRVPTAARPAPAPGTPPKLAKGVVDIKGFIKAGGGRRALETIAAGLLG